MFLQNLKVINAGAASQGLREGEKTALSTSPLLQQQLHRVSKSPLACVPGLPCQPSGK